MLQEWAALRESLKGQRLCGHERTGENLAVCTYSGGARILVNAGDEDARDSRRTRPGPQLPRTARIKQPKAAASISIIIQ